MITNPTLISIIELLALVFAIAWLLVVAADLFTGLWKGATQAGRSGFIFLVLISCLYAGTKPNASPRRRSAPPSGEIQTTDKVLNYTLCSVVTNSNYSYSAPSNATLYGSWSAHGAYQSWTSVNLAPFSFGYGDIRASSFAAFTGGFLRPTPRDSNHQLGLGPTPMLALQGVSEFWWAETRTGGWILTWNRFFPNCDTNNPVSFQLELYPSGCYITRSNNVEQVFRVVHAEDDVPTPYINLPHCVFVNNDNEREVVEDDFREIVLGVRPSSWGAEIGARLSFSCTSGADHIRLWNGDGNYGTPIDRFETTIYDEFANTLYVEGISTSARQNDVTFEMSLTTADGTVYTATNQLTVAKVKNVNLSSRLAIASENPPPFEGQRQWLFCPTNSPAVDKHLAIPFKRVVNASDMTVQDFAVDLSIELEPSGFQITGENACWYKLEGTPESGYFTDVQGRSAKFSNPKVGGIYHFGVTYAGSPQSECNLVLPLSGASVDNQLLADIALCEAAVSNIVDYMARNNISTLNMAFEEHLFWNYGHGDYLGRPDSADSNMAWYYNQVNDDSGQGALCTLYGYPVRIAKLSNFMTGYAMERMGVPSIGKAFAQSYGTKNDRSASITFNAGVAIAAGSDYQTTLSNAMFNCWKVKDAKTDILWPNLRSSDNHTSVSNVVDYNYNFISPEFLYMRTDDDLTPEDKK